jgi:hypothetical protein
MIISKTLVVIMERVRLKLNSLSKAVKSFFKVLLFKVGKTKIVKSTSLVRSLFNSFLQFIYGLFKLSDSSQANTLVKLCLVDVMNIGKVLNSFAIVVYCFFKFF